MPSTTRERILDAALELIQQRGFGGTAVTDIEERAGLSPGSGSFYRHFRSKEHVFGELFERELERAQQHRRAFERGPLTGDSQDALARRLLQQLDYMARIRPLITLLAREHGRFPELTGRIGDALLDRGIAEEADHLRRDLPGVSDDDDPHALLAVMVSALTGYHLSREFFGRPPADVDPARFAAALARLIAAPRPPS
ncbi:TetR/AcrR family transcriptional regulator [Planobispora takensis]|uniref:TetR family transcriptional regulator n=1 Tax=Planobispora takensis TaxID=1367882 RepID=A0A8J3WY08_9ACTN|nr:TetR/AcrR family transcriptional regulator [Planobispora takensis]GII05845.1 TetR family transcriptional regulator [Planobispora takensis]